MKWVILLALLIILAGGCLITYANTLPVYTNPDARTQLSSELGDKESGEKRFEEWFSRLVAIETPHKKIADLGRGLLAGGLGLIASIALTSGYSRYAWVRSSSTLYIIWLALWLVRIPLSFWYYSLRQLRGDYPSWGDSIAIPIFSEIIIWGIGAVVSSLALFLLGPRWFGRTLQFPHPQSIGGWIRLVMISLWLMLNAVCVYSGVRYGNEGMAFSCLVASAVLVIFLSAEPKESPQIQKELSIDESNASVSNR